MTDRFGYDLSRTADQIRPDYRFSESCRGTVPPALTCALEATDFIDAIRTAISIGGDSDTIAASYPAVWPRRFSASRKILQGRDGAISRKTCDGY